MEGSAIWCKKEKVWGKAAWDAEWCAEGGAKGEGCRKGIDEEGIWVKIEYLGVGSLVEEEQGGRWIERGKGIVLNGEGLEEGCGAGVGNGRGGVDAGDVGGVWVVMEKGEEEGACLENLGIGC